MYNFISICACIVVSLTIAGAENLQHPIHRSRSQSHPYSFHLQQTVFSRHECAVSFFFTCYFFQIFSSNLIKLIFLENDVNGEIQVLWNSFRFSSRMVDLSKRWLNLPSSWCWGCLVNLWNTSARAFWVSGILKIDVGLSFNGGSEILFCF